MSGMKPRQAFSQVAGVYKTAVSYGERSIEWRTPSFGVISCKRDLLSAPYHEGVFQASLEVLHAAEGKATGRQVGLLDSEYEIRWTEAVAAPR